ncbi:MAG: hypothetical protein Q4C54_02670 [Clostridia bacterium]|nr:hypothetical protein [Clostridia bacterium]
MARENRITLCLPGQADHSLVLRTMVGGVAYLYDLSVDDMDDLRAAADEAFDCLLHQGSTVESITTDILREDGRVSALLTAAFGEKQTSAPGEEENEISLAVLKTIMPDVQLTVDGEGRIAAIRLTLSTGRAS